jgi:uncharacterized membrane protein
MASESASRTARALSVWESATAKASTATLSGVESFFGIFGLLVFVFVFVFAVIALFVAVILDGRTKRRRRKKRGAVGCDLFSVGRGQLGIDLGKQLGHGA